MGEHFDAVIRDLLPFASDETRQYRPTIRLALCSACYLIGFTLSNLWIQSLDGFNRLIGFNRLMDEVLIFRLPTFGLH